MLGLKLNHVNKRGVSQMMRAFWAKKTTTVLNFIQLMLKYSWWIVSSEFTQTKHVSICFCTWHDTIDMSCICFHFIKIIHIQYPTFRQATPLISAFLLYCFNGETRLFSIFMLDTREKFGTGNKGILIRQRDISISKCCPHSLGIPIIEIIPFVNHLVS